MRMNERNTYHQLVVLDEVARVASELVRDPPHHVARLSRVFVTGVSSAGRSGRFSGPGGSRRLGVVRLPVHEPPLDQLRLGFYFVVT